MSSTHEILILGAHHAGLKVVHYLLRHVIPKLSATSPSTNYHLIIVSPNIEFYCNVAAPRFLAGENLIPAKDIFLPTAPAFESYDAEKFEFITGKAVALDSEGRTVTVNVRGTERNVRYSSLVIATGCSYACPIWQINDSEEITKSELASMTESLQAAKTVLICGGGTCGVETAGEIGTYFPGAEITLLSGTTRLLSRLLLPVSSAAETNLKNLGVSTIHGLRVSSSSKNPDGSTNLKLDDGSERKVDVFIDATGGKPNSSFLPSSWLSSSGHVIVDEQTLRVTAPGVEGVYAIGYVTSHSEGDIMAANNGVAPVCANIGIDINKKAGSEGVFEQKVYKAMTGTQIVPTGPKGGVGQIMGWSIPSFLVWLAKSRTYGVFLAKSAVEGATNPLGGGK